MLRERAFRGPLTVAVLVVPLVLGSALGFGGCQGKGKKATPPVTTPTTPSTVAPTTSTMPTTTVYQATAPQATKELAGSHFIAAWRTGDQAAALTDATPAAVTAVFAQPYPAGGIQSRGCSSAVAGPSFCTYRIIASGSLVELSVIQVTGGWSVSAAQIES